jgi:hypothetical protein
MDNLKLVGKTGRAQNRLKRVANFSNVTHMEFGLDKHAKTAIGGEKLVQSRSLIPDSNTERQ